MQIWLSYNWMIEAKTFNTEMRQLTWFQRDEWIRGQSSRGRTCVSNAPSQRLCTSSGPTARQASVTALKTVARLKRNQPEWWHLLSFYEGQTAQRRNANVCVRETAEGTATLKSILLKLLREGFSRTSPCLTQQRVFCHNLISAVSKALYSHSPPHPFYHVWT